MIDLDSYNDAILQNLQSDGRMSNIELAKNVGLSPSACLRRVQELERRGILKGYRAIIDPKAMGKDVVVFVMVGLSGHLRKDSLAFEAAMDRAPEVQECHNITGSVEYLLRVEVADLSAYKAFHADALGRLSMVGSITSHIVLGASKDRLG
jgi:DNA-binding Lrp family transcriptional regulator